MLYRPHHFRQGGNHHFHHAHARRHRILFSCAVSQLPINYLLVTALAPAEIHYVADLRAKGIEVKVQPSAHTVYFENIYAENQDERTQNVLEKADPFGVEQLENIAAKVFHLGPLLADDIDLNLIKTLASKSRVSIDVQGYLREVVNQKVRAVDWPQKKEALQYAHTVKADVAELQALTGLNDPKNGARLLAEWGVAEVVVTNGSGGSFILSGGEIYTIPAYRPKVIVDATGCGDTYMAGYLYSRIKGEGIQAAGEFAAAMASLKMEHPGPFTGTEADVKQLLEKK